MNTGVEKMLRVVIGMKGDQICTKKPLQQFVPPGNTTESLSFRKRDMLKITNGKQYMVLTYQLREKHQLVIVNPDFVLRRKIQAQCGFTEYRIDVLIHHPIFFVKNSIRQDIVKNGP